ncbi:MAG: ribosomal-processing cysteine protease Prp [Clostridia bacterium]|nr:ribosomal-processing cysteine protease Prp [Clostridia bacterium]MBR6300340.1 ribosomal-processing cysteine protease Prp [Clostridia bacterium]
MTRVTLFIDSQKRLTGFECAGHSGYAESGSDIVCAAVSALSLTCINAMESVAGIRPAADESDGHLIVTLNEEQLTHDAQVILKTFEQGIKDIAASYPKYVRFHRMVK